jgi:hypothetical protein
LFWPFLTTVEDESMLTPIVQKCDLSSVEKKVLSPHDGFAASAVGD